MGLSLGAMGNNEQMVVTLGVNPEVMKIIGVGVANGLVAVSGAMTAQYQGFADVNLGTGIVVQGLAMVMLGEFLISSNKIYVLTFRVLLGAILYKAIMYYGRYYGYYIHLTPQRSETDNRTAYYSLPLPFQIPEYGDKKTGVECHWREEEMIQLEKINMIFGEGTPNRNHVLRDLSLKVNQGDFITIVGSNGAGKTTLYQCPVRPVSRHIR